MTNEFEKNRLMTLAERCQLLADGYGLLLPILQEVGTDLASGVAFTQVENRIDDVESQLKELEKLLMELTQEEVEKFRENLKRDYQEFSKTLKELAVAAQNLPITDEKLVAIFKEMKIPELDKILNAFGLRQMVLYKEMEKAGLRPRLQMTPLGESTASYLQVVVAYLKHAESINNVPFPKLADDRLVSAESYLMDVETGGLLRTGGKERDQLSQGNHQWLVEIVPTAEEERNSNAPELAPVMSSIRISSYYNESLAKGYHFLNFDSFLSNLLSIRNAGGENTDKLLKGIKGLPGQGYGEIHRSLLDESCGNSSQLAWGMVRRTLAMRKMKVILTINDGGGFSEVDLRNLRLSRTIRLNWNKGLSDFVVQ